MGCPVSKTGSDRFTLALSGDLSIRSIADAHGQLGAALRDHADVAVAVADDAVVDLTLVQLICAARRSADEAGKTFAMAAPAGGTLLETLRRGGFTATAGQRSFWLLEENPQ